MSYKKFPDDLKPFDELNSNQKEFLIEHYKRCGAFWMHWTSTIWSLPSIAAAINVGTYSLIFDTGRELETIIKVTILFILVVLNFALMIGVWKHKYLQKVFGERILDLERYASIPTIEFTKLQNKISAGLFYLIAILIIFISSLLIFIWMLHVLICALM